MVISPKLVIVVDPSHLFVVLCYCRWTGIGVGAAISVLPRNTVHLRRIGISGDDGDRLIVLPQGDGQVPRLARLALTSLLEPLLHKGLQLGREPFAV